MKLVSLLNKNLIYFNLEASTKENAIRKLVDHITSHIHFNTDKQSILESVFARESLGGTVYSTGIAIPHARLENFNDTVCCVGIPSKPIIDKSGKIEMIILVLTSKTASRVYLGLLSCFVQLSLDRKLFEKIINLNEVHADKRIDKLFQELGSIIIKQEIMVENIMEDEFLEVHQDDTVRCIVDQFYHRNISYAPVINEKREIIGEVSILDIFKAGLPEYTMMMKNINFLNTLEPFEELLEKEDKILVRDIMKTPAVIVQKKTPAVLAALQMVQHQRLYLPVVDKNQLLGIVSYTDILYKVIRG